MRVYHDKKILHNGALYYLCELEEISTGDKKEFYISNPGAYMEIVQSEVEPDWELRCVKDDNGGSLHTFVINRDNSPASLDKP
jgi:hypothetical protein